MNMSDTRILSTRMKRAVKLSVDATLLEDAKALGINLSRTFEAGLRAAVAKAKAAAWRRENTTAIESSNAWVAEHGLPLARFRQFR